jgi:short-subunit dehydrogenase
MGKAKVAILGGTRGLGAALAKNWLQKGHPVWISSRKRGIGHELGGENCFWKGFDFSQKSQWPALVQALDDWGPEILIYCAGGGPFGQYGNKAWKDQEWAFQVTFECPAFLLWTYCRAESLKSVKNFVVIGSVVAEAQPDPQASMYCASKHALRGLIGSLQKEYPEKGIGLFSAPYMDTDLLPAGAWPRRQQDLVRPPALVAEELVNSLLQ